MLALLTERQRREGGPALRARPASPRPLRRADGRAHPAAQHVPRRAAARSRSSAGSRAPSAWPSRSSRSSCCSPTRLIDVATALTAGLAMQQLAGRLSTITSSIASLIESGMFIDDFHAFIELGAGALERRRGDRARGGRRAPRAPARRVDASRSRYPGAPHPRSKTCRSRSSRARRSRWSGANGSGKTTLVKLICQLYQPRDGRMLWNGVETGALDRQSVTLRDHRALPGLPRSTTCRARQHRLRPCRPRARRSRRSVAAARRAGAHEFIDAPAGRLSTRGSACSSRAATSSRSGQWQRLALARAFFRGGSLLDPRRAHRRRSTRAPSATSSQQIAGARRGPAVLLISHRFSSVRSADRIYVMASGRIVESGAHDELMARKGVYAELFEMQAAGYLGNQSVRSVADLDAEPYQG